MNSTLSDKTSLDELLASLPEGGAEPTADPTPSTRPRRNIPQMMRKIPVTLTLEVGSARLSLQELTEVQTDSVVPLDTLAGEPLVIKVNGTAVGRGEVVVTGEKYGLRVIELAG